MHAALAQLRRLVASLMLVAMASFVLHGSAMAGMHGHGTGPHGTAAAECGPHASSAGHGHHHHHGAAAPDHHGHDGDCRQDASAELCCGSACTVAIHAAAPHAGWMPVVSPVVLTPGDVSGRDARPDGLKRPPRTPCTA